MKATMTSVILKLSMRTLWPTCYNGNQPLLENDELLSNVLNMWCTHSRFDQGKIYSNAGRVLISVNPYITTVESNER